MSLDRGKHDSTGTSDDVKVRAFSTGYMESVPDATMDKKSKVKTIEWSSTENNSWHENIGVIDNAPTVKGLESVYDRKIYITERSFMPMCWRLSDEGDNTVLHCYFQMKADVVINLWLGNDESCILDKETGIIYQARATVPAACYNKVFGLKGKEDTVFDLQILFPRLPDSARELAIYGVPAWGMRGTDVEQDGWSADANGLSDYDPVPQFHTPEMMKDSTHYDKNDSGSWAVYSDAHLIKPVEENTMALWRTPDATYLAIATEQNWFREYHGRGGNTMLLDQQGHQYKCRGVMDYPNDRLFWLEGFPGDYFAMVLVFDPLPTYVKTFTYVVPESEPFTAWGANWSGEVISNLDVQQLRQNKSLFEYHPRLVVRQPTNFIYSTDKYYTLTNQCTGARLGISFDYNIHASAYREKAPSGRGPNGIQISDDKVFHFKFIPTAVSDTCSANAPCRDCYIVNEDMFALEDGSETSEGQWIIFRYLDKNRTTQQWSLYEKDGTVTIINKATGRCVDLAGGSPEEGTSIFSYAINDSPQSNANQKWVITEAE